MVNTREGKESNGLTVGNSKKIKLMKARYLASEIVSKNGKVIGKVKLKDAVMTPPSKFNLLLITKMIQEG